MTRFSEEIIDIPIEEINILNKRNRNKTRHTEITDNIVAVGIKNPILVRPNNSKSGKKYDLICGQGRIESMIACGQTSVPAIIRHISRKEAAIESIAENSVRRPQSSAANIAEIKRMRDDGNTPPEIARKIGMSSSQMHRMITLIERGEDRLLAGAESGKIPLNVAVQIAETDRDEQHVLQEAYEKGLLKGRSLIEAKKMLQRRSTYGKSLKRTKKQTEKQRQSAVTVLMSDYKAMVSRKKKAVQKSEIVEVNLKFIAEAIYVLLKDENYRTLLKAENLTDLPKWLYQSMEEKGLNPW